MIGKYLIYLLLFCYCSIVQADIKSDVEKIIAEKYKTVSGLFLNKRVVAEEVKQRIENLVKQKFFRDYVYTWSVCSNDSLLGYAVLDNVYGKSLPITFLVIFSNVGKIEQVDIVRYREPYGGSVRSRNWLDQFYGKPSSDAFLIDKDIDAISGATISTHAISRGVRKLLLLMEYFLPDLPATCPDKTITNNYGEKGAK